MLIWCREKTRNDDIQSKKRMREEQRKQSIAENATIVGVDNPYENNRVRRWRKCASIVEELVDRLNSQSTGLTVIEKKDVIRRFAEDERIIGLLPSFMKETKETEEKLKLVSSVQQAYNQMVANKSTENSMYRNALLSAVVSPTNGPSQLFLARTLKATRHTLRKAVVRRAYIDDVGEKFWGGIPRKNRNDRVSEDDRQKIMSFWDTATTISPISKDILYQRTGPWQFNEHPKHYLQESQVTP